MPDTEHGARNRGKRVLGKVGGGQGGCKAGVLHADFNGDSPAFASVQLKRFADRETEQVAQHVMADDHSDNQQAACQLMR